MVCEYLHIFNFVILGHSTTSLATGVRRQLRVPSCTLTLGHSKCDQLCLGSIPSPITEVSWENIPVLVESWYGGIIQGGPSQYLEDIPILGGY